MEETARSVRVGVGEEYHWQVAAGGADRGRNLFQSGGLYVVAIDRAVVSVHARHLHDPAASNAERWLAAQRIRDTFFYRHTAQREVARAKLE